MKPAEVRFWAKVQKTDGCWLWTAGFGGPKRMPYGAFWLDGRMHRAHRVAWEFANGRRPTEEEVIMHACDEPRCVRPDHLLLGDVTANNWDMMQKGRYGYGRRKLTRAQVEEIRARSAAGETQRAIAPDYGITQQTVSDVCRNERVWT